MKVHWVDPETQEPLEQRDGALWNPRTGASIAVLEGGIPRFVRPQENYAESFGWQWQHWARHESG